jgi:hypothetical protein
MHPIKIKIKRAKRTREPRPQAPPRGVIVYRGPSLIDGSPLIVVLTGIRGSSRNEKTSGKLPLAQSYIIPAAMLQGITGRCEAHAADYLAWGRNLRGGCDGAACGSCSKRPAQAAGAGVNASSLPTDPCYVRNGPPEVARAIVRGTYPDATPTQAAAYVAASVAAGRIAGVRAGAWGDPAAAPLAVHAPILDAARATSQPSGRRGVATAYTRRWIDSDGRPSEGVYLWRHYAMASAHTVAEARDAVFAGWRPFLVVDPRDASELDATVALAATDGGYLHCPASRERATDVGCADCGACNGGTGPIVAIASHGHYTRGATACAAADSMLARIHAGMRARRERWARVGGFPALR